MYISRLSEKQMVENQYLPLWNWLQQSAVQGALSNNRGGLMLSRIVIDIIEGSKIQHSA